MQPFQLKTFLEKFAAGTYTEAEHQQFIEWSKTASMEEIEAVMEKCSKVLAEAHPVLDEVDADLSSHIEASIDQYELGKTKNSGSGKVIPWRKLYRLVAAALVIFISGTVIYFTLKNPKPSSLSRNQVLPSTNEVMPGGNKAILTLSDGSNVILDDTKNGQVARQGSSQVDKLANGQIVYNSLSGKTAEVVYNTLTTPRGGQFKLRLPDGSEVWLNAASSIRYPTAFVGNERRVEITGEAYFEIAHNAAKPFKVSLNGIDVQVLGTHFNVNGYNDEASVKTTLLEGSVRLTKGNSAAMLRPGQQAQLGSSGPIKVVDNVDVDQVVAWKNGYFSFNRADLQTVMREISRWYDVEINYEGKIPERQFGGKIDRNSNASEVLKILAESKVHFRIESKKIIVGP